MSDFFERVQTGKLAIIDGGTGTEMEKRGAKMEEEGWSASCTLTAPDLLRGIHEDYIKAGAEVIISNTFSTSKEVLEACNLGHQFEELNARAVEIAREARDSAAAEHEVWVAGSLSAVVFGRGKKPRSATLQANFEHQAEILAESGIDFFMLEMMNDIDNTLMVYEAAAKTGLPIIVGFTANQKENGDVRLGLEHYPPGRPLLADAVKALPSDVPMIAVMHSQTIDVQPALDVIHENFDGPTGAYAHWGKFVMPNWQFNDTISAEAYADEAEKWVAAGIRMVGGCCGIGPAHIQELKSRFG